MDCAVAVDGVRSAIPYRLRRLLTAIPGTGATYDSSSIAKEARGLATALRRPRVGGVLHYLDGERDVGYLPRALHLSGWRTVATFHTPPHTLERLVGRRRFQPLDAAIALGSNQVDILTTLLGGPRVHRLPYGVDTDFFCPLDAPRSPTSLLFVGAHLRDFAVLMEAVDALHGRFPSLQVTAVTSPWGRRQLTPRPWFDVVTGLSDAALRAAYQRASLLMLPMTDAVACTALLEAMASGLPAVVTDVGAMRDYLPEDGGAFTAPGSVEHMVETTSSLLEADPAVRAAMAAAARARALDFAWPRVAQAVSALYDDVADGSTRR